MNKGGTEGDTGNCKYAYFDRGETGIHPLSGLRVLRERCASDLQEGEQVHWCSP